MELKTLGIRLNVPATVLRVPYRILLPAKAPRNGIHAAWHMALKNHALWMERHGTKVTFTDWNYQKHGPEMTELWVNEFRVGIDFSDMAQLSYWTSAYNFVFMKNCIPAHEHFCCISSIPHFVFPSWEEALAKMAEVDGIKQRNPVVLYTDNVYGPDDRPRLNARRTYVRQLLEEAFGKRLIGQIPDRAEYFRAMASAAGIVHLGGAFNGSQDRTTVEVMLLGRCLIQPEIQSLIGDERPRPGVHYLACWDDYSDLVERCQELLDCPHKAIEIGRNAREFILKSMAPEAFWHRILRCCVERC